MKKNKISIQTLSFVFCWLLVASLLAVGSGCKAGKTLAVRSSIIAAETPGNDKALVSVFLRLRQETPSGIWLRMDSLSLVADDRVTPLAIAQKEFSAGRIQGGQRFVARGSVAPVRYHSLRVAIDKAALERGGEKIGLAVPDPIVDFPLPANFQLQGRESRSLFLIWDEEKSLEGRALFVPKFVVTYRPQIFLANLAFVSCPDIDTLYMYRTDRNWVTGSLNIAGGPTYMAYNAPLKKLYVLAQKTSEIVVVKVTTGQILDRFKIPLTKEPTFFFSPDGVTGYVLDEAGDYLIRIDLAQGTIEKRVKLGYSPRYAAWRGTSNGLVISSARSQYINLVHPESLSTTGVIAVGSGPRGMVVDNDFLYVAESGSNSLGIYSLRSRTLHKRVNVGFSPRRLLKDGDNIYVSNFNGGSVSLFLVRQQQLYRDIRVGGKPFELDFSSRRKFIYAADRKNGQLAVVDQTGNQLVGSIELGAKPLDILVVE